MSWVGQVSDEDPARPPCPRETRQQMGWISFLELDADPYDPEEADPAKSRALESCLWELQVRVL